MRHLKCNHGGVVPKKSIYLLLLMFLVLSFCSSCKSSSEHADNVASKAAPAPEAIEEEAGEDFADYDEKKEEDSEEEEEPESKAEADKETAPDDDAKPSESKSKSKKSSKGKGSKDGKKTWKRSKKVANTSRLKVGDNEDIPLKGMQVNARVDGFRARVVIDFFFFNENDRQYEGTFQMRLPNGASPYFLAFGQSSWTAPKGQDVVQIPRYDDAQVLRKQGYATQELMDSRAASWIDPKQARMVPKEKAAFAYKQTVRRRVDPALMEWSGSGVFSTRIFPIMPRKLHRVVVGYDVDLTRVGQDYELRLALPGNLPSSSVDINVAHVGQSQIVVTPQTKGSQDGPRSYYHLDNPKEEIVVRVNGLGDHLLQGKDAETGAYMAAHISPMLPTAPAGALADAGVFMVDTSLSANPDKFNVWLALLKELLDNNRDAGLKRFAVLFFNIETFWWQKQFVANTPENVAKLMTYANTLALEGATDLGASLHEGARPSWGNKDDSWDLFLLSDGAATWGENDAYSLSHSLKEGQAKALFAYQTGMSGSDTRMLRHLARETGGAVFSVVGESEIAAASKAHQARPWTIVKTAVSGASDLLLAGRPQAIFPGQRLMLVGRGEVKPGATLDLHLRQGNREKTLTVLLNKVIASPMAPRAYGQVAVGQVEDFLTAVRPQAEAYARHFRVTGRSTSLLMLESEQDYLNFGIKPKDDAAVIQAKPASILVANALDQLAERLGNPKADFFDLLTRMGAMPGVQMNVTPELRSALDKLPAKAFRVQTPRLVCKDHTWNAVSAGFKAQLAMRKPTYDDATAEAERRRTKFGAADALKALSSMVEASPGDGVLARDVGFTAMEWGLHGHAYHLFRRVAKSRPFEPQTWRAMALALAEQKQHNLALAYFELALAGQWDARFGEFRKITMLDYLRFLERSADQQLDAAVAAYARNRRATLKQELKLGRADVLVTIAWNTDSTDVDLHVLEPGGEECYYGHNKTSNGGRITQDVTQGYGPEMYVMPNAKKGTYRIRAKYFSSNANRASARTKVYATVYRNWGTRDEKVTQKVVTLAYGKDMHDIATLKIP